MKKEIERLLPKALESVPQFLFQENTQVVEKEYDGYAASFGAAVRTSGLIPTLVFYTDVSRDKEEIPNNGPRRYKLLQAMAYIYGIHVERPNKRTLLEYILKDIYGAELLERSLNRDGTLPKVENYLPDEKQLNVKLRSWKKKVLNASIALKLAMRNFPHSDDNAQ